MERGLHPGRAAGGCKKYVILKTTLSTILSIFLILIMLLVGAGRGRDRQGVLSFDHPQDMTKIVFYIPADSSKAASDLVSESWKTCQCSCFRLSVML